ncbi:MAG: insulinase family protein [Oscillospiraceae bacterium]|nr:insulinase family protein [Oscillospiraceae bacterium]
MNINDLIHGFRVKYVQEQPEIHAKLWRMEYEKNGADLVWLEREDDNKTFAITFKTIPQDHTGVFHIIEHSVLCGSEKYPVREPFVELLKSSLQTFLNAFTFPDKTMYPVCSRNDKDFLNLIDVYMDAVLHPLSISDPNAFRQEGWHYEAESAEGELSFNGVVYNEMKGAFASSDEVLANEMGKLLAPDHCYGYCSGGDPEHIPELTYEGYKASHARFYHPSNSYIFLDGSMNLDAVLAKLDGFLSAYDRIDPQSEIPMLPPAEAVTKTVRYEIAPEEVQEDRVILAEGWVGPAYDEKVKNLALSILEDVLCGSNEAPLTKAILDEELAEDVCFVSSTGIQQTIPMLSVRNAAPENVDRIFALVDSTLKEQAEKGLDKELLSATINHLEFTTREKDFGAMPKGLVYGMMAMESWLYGGDPAMSYSYDECFRELREGVENGLFENLIREVYLNETGRVRLVMLPDPEVGNEKRKAEAQRCADAKSAMSEAQIQQVLDELAQLRIHQETPDTPEQLQSLPQLSLSDISEEVPYTKQNVYTIDGTTVLHNEVATDGITYAEILFNISDLPQSELSAVSFLSGILGQMPTENYTVLGLKTEIGSKMGNFETGVASFGEPKDLLSCRSYLRTVISMLDSRRSDALAITQEILCRTRLDDGKLLLNHLRQDRQEKIESITMAGSSYAVRRIQSAESAKAYAAEQFSGVDYLRWMQKTEKDCAEDLSAFCAQLQQIYRRVFTRSRAVISITGEYDESFARAMLEMLPQGEGSAEAVAHYSLNAPVSEGIVIPADVGFAAKAININTIGEQYLPSFHVGAQYLNYGYLWNNVRVKGGAYGVGIRTAYDGDFYMSSYRDPAAAQTLQTFNGVGQDLRQLCESDESIDNYIISTIGETEPLLSPRLLGAQATGTWLSRRTNAQRAAARKKILHTTKDELKQFADVLDHACKEARVCVVGSKAAIEACGDVLTTITSII